MIYHCGHQGCNVCGARECGKTDLKTYFKDYILCDYCLRKAIKLAIRMAEEFGGTIIDLDKKCGEEKRPPGCPVCHIEMDKQAGGRGWTCNQCGWSKRREEEE